MLRNACTWTWTLLPVHVAVNFEMQQLAAQQNRACQKLETRSSKLKLEQEQQQSMLPETGTAALHSMADTKAKTTLCTAAVAGTLVSLFPGLIAPAL